MADDALVSPQQNGQEKMHVEDAEESVSVADSQGDDEEYQEDDADSEEQDEEEDDWVDEEDEDGVPTRSSRRVGRGAEQSTARTARQRELEERKKASSSAKPKVADAEIPVDEVKKRGKVAYEEGTCWCCGDYRTRHNNSIVYCSECKVGYHQQCYGMPLVYGVPPGHWACKTCRSRNTTSKQRVSEWQSALTTYAQQQHIASQKCGLSWFARQPAAPAFDVWDEDGASPEYREWAGAVLREDPNFIETWHFLSCFGTQIGILEPFTFEALQSALINSTISGALADAFSKILKCLGFGASVSSWPQTLATLVSDDDTEDFNDMLKLARAFLSIPYPGSTGAHILDSEALEESGAGMVFSFFLLPLPLKTCVLKTVQDMLLVCTHKNNSRLHSYLQDLEEGRIGKSRKSAEDVDLNQYAPMLRSLSQPTFSQALLDPKSLTVEVPSTRKSTPLIESAKKLLDYAEGHSATIPFIETDAGESGSAGSTQVQPLADTIASTLPDHMFAALRSLNSDGGQESTVIAVPQDLLTPAENEPVVNDSRCIRYYFFQDADGEIRLVRHRAGLLTDSQPRNGALRQLTVIRTAARGQRYLHPPSVQDNLPVSGSKRPRTEGKEALETSAAKRRADDAVINVDDITDVAHNAVKLTWNKDADSKKAKKDKKDKPEKVDRAEKHESKDKKEKDKIEKSDSKDKKDKKEKAEKPDKVAKDEKAKAPQRKDKEGGALRQTTLSFGGKATPEKHTGAAANASAEKPKGMSLLSFLTVPKKSSQPASEEAVTAAGTPEQPLATAVDAGNSLPDTEVTAVGPANDSNDRANNTHNARLDTLDSPVEVVAVKKEVPAEPASEAKGKSKRAEKTSTKSVKPDLSKEASKLPAAEEQPQDPLLPLPLPDGLTLVMATQAAVKMSTDFETVATTIEELQVFADVMLVHPDPVEQALGLALRNNVLPVAIREKKALERRTRQKNRLVDGLTSFYASGDVQENMYGRRTRSANAVYNVDAVYESLGVR